jgi:hypothetical protein
MLASVAYPGQQLNGWIILMLTRCTCANVCILNYEDEVSQKITRQNILTASNADNEVCSSSTKKNKHR